MLYVWRWPANSAGHMVCYLPMTVPTCLYRPVINGF